jgi:DNA gyrase inhibitor GyrI
MTPSPTIHIIRLAAMRVASSYGFGENPEEIAWHKMSAWAKPKALLNDLDGHPLFGLNNPYPTPATPRYGYEFWLQVGPEVEPDGDIRIGEFFGGEYAVMRCEVSGHPEHIPAAWQSLAVWCKNNGYTMGTHHALERFLSIPDDLSHLLLELHCPIVKSQKG